MAHRQTWGKAPRQQSPATACPRWRRSTSPGCPALCWPGAEPSGAFAVGGGQGQPWNTMVQERASKTSVEGKAGKYLRPHHSQPIPRGCSLSTTKKTSRSHFENQ